MPCPRSISRSLAQAGVLSAQTVSLLPLLAQEFARVITAKDVFNLEDLQIVEQPQPVEKKMSKRQKALMAKRAMGLK